MTAGSKQKLVKQQKVGSQTWEVDEVEAILFQPDTKDLLFLVKWQNINVSGIELLKYILHNSYNLKGMRINKERK